MSSAIPFLKHIFMLIVISTANIAIINNKPVTTTLQANLFKRKGTNVDDLYYHIVYNDDDIEDLL